MEAHSSRSSFTLSSSKAASGMESAAADEKSPPPPSSKGPWLSPIWRVALLSSFTSVGALLFGMDTGSIGGITTMSWFHHDIGELSELMRGVLVALILMSSSVSGVLAGKLADSLSRRLALALGFGVYAFGSIICSASKNLGMLASGRVLAGIGEGIFLSCSMTYIAEVSPKRSRGRMASIFQCMWGGGIAIGYFLCMGSVRIPSTISWRLPFMLQAIIATMATVAAPFIPESPRWLLLKGKKEEAERVLDLITGKSDEQQAERLELLSFGAKGTEKPPSFLSIFHKEVRRRTFLGLFVQVFQMLSGIDAVLYFAPIIFKQAGLDEKTASFLASGVTGIVGFATNLAVPLYIDRIGRRALFVAGGLSIGISQLVLGTIYASGANTTPAGKWTIVVFVELFMISFSFSWSTVTRLYASEIQPTSTRASSIALGSAANQATNCLVALTAPMFLEHTPFGPYFLYGGASLFAAIFGLIFMPETRGKSLEAIDAHFNETPTHATWSDVIHHHPLPSVASMDALASYFDAHKDGTSLPWQQRYSTYGSRVESTASSVHEEGIEEDDSVVMFMEGPGLKRSRSRFGSRVESETYSRGTTDPDVDSYSSYGGRTVIGTDVSLITRETDATETLSDLSATTPSAKSPV